MSTYWGYVCKAHEPPIESEHWFNHGQHILAEVLTSERAGEWPSDEWGDPGAVNHRGYVTDSPVVWLRQHPHCKVWLRNEYGDEFDPAQESD